MENDHRKRPLGPLLIPGIAVVPCGDLAALSLERRPVQEVKPGPASLTG